MIDKDLYVLAVALAISGFLAYKTFRWALYQEIGPGLTALFLAFTVVVFFAINSYDFIPNWIGSEAGERAVKVMDAELRKQIETTRLLAETVREAAVSANASAAEANKKGQAALEAIRKSKGAEEIVSITARASWETLMGQFQEIEGYLRRWEINNGLKREWAAPHSLSDLTQKLERFGKTLPEPIKGLYFERQQKYEILKKLKEISASSALPLFQVGLDLPPPPKLPAPMPLSGQSGNADLVQ